MATHPARDTTPLIGGFHRRGQERTRLETFIDAAFAFALTMLVISIDRIPQNIPQLVEALKDAPAFGTSFALIMLYWRAHQVWSDRYGLEDIPSILLSSLLIFVIMVYVYPLKILFGTMFHALSNGWLQSRFRLETYADFRHLLIIYGIGFFVLNLCIAALYIHAWRLRAQLTLNTLEQFLTRSEITAWTIVASFGLVSVILASILDGFWLQTAAWLYCLLAIVMPLYAWREKRLVAALKT